MSYVPVSTRPLGPRDVFNKYKSRGSNLLDIHENKVLWIVLGLVILVIIIIAVSMNKPKKEPATICNCPQNIEYTCQPRQNQSYLSWRVLNHPYNGSLRCSSQNGGVCINGYDGEGFNFENNSGANYCESIRKPESMGDRLMVNGHWNNSKIVGDQCLCSYKNSDHSDSNEITISNIN
jgi:hypothetical protein